MTMLSMIMQKTIIDTALVKQSIMEIIKECSFVFPERVKADFNRMLKTESDSGAIETLKLLVLNAELAEKNKIPLCQDCGTVIVFLKIGQDVSLDGVFLADAINSGVEEAYKDFYLRKSIVSDPFIRLNSGTNTPSVIHTDIVRGNSIEVTVYLKGGGSENMTMLKMFRPTASIEEIIDFVEESVVNSGPNACPPLYLGIGIGGTADEAVLNSKKAVLRDETHDDAYYAELEANITDRLNKTNVGPLGFGGRHTVAGVYIKPAPAHIASLPVAINMSCHSLRYGKRVIIGTRPNIEGNV
jgi:fumarate hydratase subunit alpha